jgi:zinc/manganese transport system substrate-binding protein
MRKTWAIFLMIVIVVGAGIYLFIWLGRMDTARKGPHGGVIQIVAAEDFYGNIAKQLGGNKVDIISILSDPNVDPHEYESNVQDGIAITNADMVIENGAQYDSWIDKLLRASPNTGRILITAAQLTPDPLKDNPHVWYDIDTISATARAITLSLKEIDPVDASIYDSNFASFNASLAVLTAKMNEIKSGYAGTAVGLTETIYLYQTRAMGLNVITPLDFEKAVAEGNDPSAQSVNIMNGQITGKQMKALIYNSQTVTPITSNLQNAAIANGITVVPVTEMMPASDTYQSWMMGELDVLQTALARP